MLMETVSRDVDPSWAAFAAMEPAASPAIVSILVAPRAQLIRVSDLAKPGWSRHVHSSLIFGPKWTGSRRDYSRFLKSRSRFSLTVPVKLEQFQEHEPFLSSTVTLGFGYLIQVEAKGFATGHVKANW